LRYPETAGTLPKTSTVTEELAQAEQPTLNKADIRRMRNTEAARQSRRRKTEQLRSMELKMAEMEESNKTLEHANTVLKTQNEGYADRIKLLEKQMEEMMGVLLAFGANNIKRLREEQAANASPSKRAKTDPVQP
jgi:recombination DNA repair RAD52 pathway protein